MTALAALLAIGSGGIVGFTLGLVGGGGSIMAVPLLVYVVGVATPHVAIGTSAVAVAASAAANLVGHARAHTVKWNCAAVFALAGVAGAAAGAHFGKLIDGGRLLTLFGVLMIFIGVLMLRPRKSGDHPDVKLTRDTLHLLPWLAGIGFLVGALSGFFGIGGGFLIVPGLMAATGSDRIRPDHGGELRRLWSRRLAARRAVHSRRRSRRSWRHRAGAQIVIAQARAHPHFLRHRHSRGCLRDDARLSSGVTIAHETSSDRQTYQIVIRHRHLRGLAPEQW